MRNVYTCCDGAPVIGKIVYGEKFPYGTVSKETHEADINALKAKDDEILNLINTVVSENISNVSTRVAGCESAIVTLRNQILNVSDNINDRYDGFNNSLTALRQDVQEIRRTVSELSVSTAASIATINQRLANLEGSEAIEILSFTANPNICEKGSTENIVLEWSVKGDVRSIKVNGEAVSGNTMTVRNLNNSKEFTLTIEDAKGITETRKVVVLFANHVYWGVDRSETITDGLVKGLDFNEVTDVRTRTITVSPDNKYIYYAYPKIMGVSEFAVGQFIGGFEEPETVVIDNHAGYAEEYYVYRSVQLLTGSIDIDII